MEDIRSHRSDWLIEGTCIPNESTHKATNSSSKSISPQEMTDRIPIDQIIWTSFIVFPQPQQPLLCRLIILRSSFAKLKI